MLVRTICYRPSAFMGSEKHKQEDLVFRKDDQSMSNDFNELWLRLKKVEKKGKRSGGISYSCPFPLEREDERC